MPKNVIDDLLSGSSFLTCTGKSVYVVTASDFSRDPDNYKWFVALSEIPANSVAEVISNPRSRTSGQYVRGRMATGMTADEAIRAAYQKALEALDKPEYSVTFSESETLH